MKAVKEGEKFRLVQKLVFTKDEEVLFNPKNANYYEALSGSKAMLTRLKRLGEDKVIEFNKQVEKSIKDDCFEELTEEEIGNLENIPHFYTMGNIVWNSNSASTSVRMINDTARPIKGMMESVSTSNYCPRQVLNKMYSTLVRFMLYQIGYSSDVQGAYRAIKCSYLDSFLRLFVWFTDMDDPDNSAVIYRRKSLDFGDGSASCSFEVASNEHVSEEAKLEISKKIIKDLRYADNNLFSFQDKLLYYLVKKDIEKAFAMFNMPLKYTISNIDVEPAQHTLFGQNIERQMGLDWNLDNNTVLPALNLSLFEKRRGKAMGPSLENTNLQDIPLTRRHLMRIASQLHDPLERHIGPVKATAKQLVSKSCDVADNSKLDTPLSDLDEDFAQLAGQFLENLKTIPTLKPYLKYVIPCGYKIHHIVMTRDGGGGGYGVTLHIVSKLLPGKIGEPWFSYILAAKSKISKRSPQANELLASVLSAILLKEVTEGLTDLSTEEFFVISAGDSVAISTFFDKTKTIKNVLVKTGVQKCQAALNDVVQKFKKMKIYFTWIRKQLNVSDVLTKFVKNPIGICNSEMWRIGYPFFKDPEALKENIFFTADIDGFQYQNLPDELTGIKQNIQAMERLNKPSNLLSFGGGEASTDKIVSLLGS